MKRIILTSVAALMLAAPAIAETSKATTDAATAKFVTTASATDARASKWLGAPIQNMAKENIGDINDFVISGDGKVTAVIAGVGGFLGLGEKNVALPFNTVEMKTGEDGQRLVTVMLSKAELEAAPAFKMTGDKTMGDRMNDAKAKAGELYEKTKKSVSETYKSAKEAVSEGAEATQEAAREAADETSDAVSGRETKVTQ
jgi:hypothetical protein